MSINSNIVCNTVLNAINLSEKACPESLFSRLIDPYQNRGAWPSGGYGCMFDREDCRDFTLKNKVIADVDQAIKKFLSDKEFSSCTKSDTWTFECLPSNGANEKLQIDYTPILRLGQPPLPGMEFRLQLKPMNPQDPESKDFLRMRLFSAQLFSNSPIAVKNPQPIMATGFSTQPPPQTAPKIDVSTKPSTTSGSSTQAAPQADLFAMSSEGAPGLNPHEAISNPPYGMSIWQSRASLAAFGIGTLACSYYTIKCARETLNLIKQHGKKSGELISDRSDRAPEHAEKLRRRGELAKPQQAISKPPVPQTTGRDVTKAAAKTLLFAAATGLCGAGTYFSYQAL